MTSKSRSGRAHLALMLVAVALASVAVLHGISASAGTAPAPQATNPFAGYAPPGGPELPAATIAATALAAAGRAGDASPAETTIAQGPLRDVMTAIDPDVAVPSAPGGGQEDWLDETVDLVSMSGSFVLRDAHVPHGHPAPTGSVLDLVIGARTGQLVGRSLLSAAPSLQALEVLPAEPVVGAGAADVTGVLSGRVYGVGGPAPGSRRPIDGAEVTAQAGARPRPVASIRTDRDGRFSLRLRPGRYLLEVRLGGRPCPAQHVLVQAERRTTTTVICRVR